MVNQFCGCNACNGKGWIESAIYDSASIANGAVVIEKCDECEMFYNDLAAAKFAYKYYQILSFWDKRRFNIKIDYSTN